MRKIVCMILALFTILPLMFVVGTSLSSKKADADVVQFIMCIWDGDPTDDDVPLIKLVYEAATTDDLQRQFFYKSQVNAEAESTKYSLPNILSGKDYDAVALDILNNGNDTTKKYTAYDRFGFAGMNFTNYNGEWNWWKIYFCRANGKGYGDAKDPEDGHLNDYYKDRDRPMSTWSGLGSSNDPRVKRRASIWQWQDNWNLLSARFLFFITKCIVALGNMLMELTLSDAAGKFGFTDVVAGSGGNMGIFKTLFNNLFLSLMAMMMIMTGVTMLFKGIIKGRMREAYGDFVWALGCLFAGLVMMLNPVTFVTLPNTIGMFAQNMLLQGITAVESSSEDSYCTTEEGNKNIKPTWVDPTLDFKKDGDKLAKSLDDASDAIRRNVECEYWRIFALQPYALGQYGSNYDYMWAAGKAPSGGKSIDQAADNNGSSVQFYADYAGDAPVPMGNKTIVNNWLLYQISTQTDKHIDSTTLDNTGDYKMDKPGSKEEEYKNPNQYSSQLIRVDGTNADWWRVVDALANFKSMGDDAADNTKNGGTVPAAASDEQPTQYWGTWIGGGGMYRVLISLLSVIFAFVGLIGPIMIGLSVVAYGIGSVLIMGFAPVALTFGMWSGHGKQVVKGYFQLLASTVMKRIILGLVFMLLTIFMIKIAGGMSDFAGYWKSMLLICVVSVIMAKNKDVFVQMFGKVNIQGAINLSPSAGQVGQSMKKKARFAGQLAGAGVVGAAGGLRHKLGGKDKSKSVTRGAARAMSAIVDKQLYSTPMGQEYLQSKSKMEMSRGAKAKRNVYCDNCNRLIIKRGSTQKNNHELDHAEDTKENGYQLMPDGRTLCQRCAHMEQYSRNEK